MTSTQSLRVGSACALGAALLVSASMLSPQSVASAQAYEPPVHSLPVAVQEHVDLSYLLLNGDVSKDHLPMLLSPLMPERKAPLTEKGEHLTVLPPTRVFDQLYVLGFNTVHMLAIDTGDGLILIDTLNTEKDAVDVIEPGLRKLGLDPAKIKYIVITHGHGDHFGGAKYLQDKYKARVLASAADWDLMKNPPARPARGDGPGAAARPAPPPRPMPTHDMDVQDGQKLTLGKVTLTLYITPGHTPGSVSMLIPVTERGKPHLLSLWGGTGVPQTLEPAAGQTAGGVLDYEKSLVRFTKIGVDAHVDGVISNHAVVDASDVKLPTFAKRKASDPNPYLTGESTYLRFMGSFVEGVRAVRTSLQAHAAAQAAQASAQATARATADAVSDVYRAQAREMAERSGFMSTYTLQCRKEAATPAGLFGPGAPEPLKLFDNFYSVGQNSVGAYVVKTSKGLILIDTLNRPEDAQQTIVPGMKKLGLDPKDIKYILISHAHGDHYGSAKWLAETYGAHVVASAVDWDVMSRPLQPPAGANGGRAAPNWGPPPTRDQTAADGQVLTLGDTSITMVITPGHTPGTLSFIVPVLDHGKKHMLAMWGGTNIPRTEEAHRQYMASFDHFDTFTKKLGVDVELSNHPFVDDGLKRMEALRKNPKGPNPFVIGTQRYDDYVGVLKACAQASM